MIYIVLPAYNEEKTLPPLLARIRDYLEEAGLNYSVIAVDDGSQDGTLEVLRNTAGQVPLIIIQHPENRGIADALRPGLIEAIKRSGEKDIIVTMDSDNTHTPGLILRMVRLIREGHDVVIGSRYRIGARTMGVPFYRRLLSFAAAFIFKLAFPIRGVLDYTSGFRAYRASALKELFSTYGQDLISEPGFSCMVDILLKLRKCPLIIGEIPLILRYDKKVGASKMDVGRTIIDTLGLIVRRFFG
jgi:dolichol-phosphate mannosyltransferase